jgi:hypothetical protein
VNRETRETQPPSQHTHNSVRFDNGITRARVQIQILYALSFALWSQNRYPCVLCLCEPRAEGRIRLARLCRCPEAHIDALQGLL